MSLNGYDRGPLFNIPDLDLALARRKSSGGSQKLPILRKRDRAHGLRVTSKRQTKLPRRRVDQAHFLISRDCNPFPIAAIRQIERLWLERNTRLYPRSR